MNNESKQKNRLLEIHRDGLRTATAKAAVQDVHVPGHVVSEIKERIEEVVRICKDLGIDEPDWTQQGRSILDRFGQSTSQPERAENASQPERAVERDSPEKPQIHEPPDRDKSPEVNHDPVNPQLVFGIGVALLLLVIGIAFKISDPTTFQFRIFAGVFAISMAAFGLGLSGMLKADINFEKRLAISATGALAIFVLVYFFAPAQ